MESKILANIRKKFNENLKGKERFVNSQNENAKYYGYEGHMIEKSLGLKINNNNEPDIDGYELKKFSSKISFGDWSATSYIFNPNDDLKLTNGINTSISRIEFLKMFGTYNIVKQRYSWSGRCIPKYNEWNYNGVKIKFNKNNDLLIVYDYSKDTRNNKNEIIKEELHNKKLILAYWKYDKIKKNLEKKFNIKGFIIVNYKKNKYDNIMIGKPIDFKMFKKLFKENKIVFDSGMYQGNSRNYSMFRASNKIWKSLLV